MLMLVRIRILDPHWKKWIHVISLRFTEIFNKAFQFFSFFRLLYAKKVFFAVFGSYFVPWIRIQETKILRILSTASQSNIFSIFTLFKI